MDILLTHLLMVAALVLGVYAFDDAVLKSDHDERWWIRVFVGANVLSIPITIVANSDMEVVMNVFGKIVR